MFKQLERPEINSELRTQNSELKKDDVGLQKAAEARALLKRIEERKTRDEEILRKEYNAIVKAKGKGGYCGC